MAFNNSPIGNPVGSKKEGRSYLDAASALKRALETHQNREKEKQRGSPPTVKATDFVSNSSRKSSHEGRQVQPADAENITQSSDDRPSTVNITSRSSRFGGAGAQKVVTTLTTLPRNSSSAKNMATSLENVKQAAPKAREPSKNATVTSTFQDTMQSYIIPDIPNISELESGTFEDGTPMFSRHTKARTVSSSSRFPSLAGRKSRVSHYPIEELAIPEDEEAIFVSLKLLQEKIADLENKRIDAEVEIQTLKEKIEAVFGALT